MQRFIRILLAAIAIVTASMAVTGTEAVAATCSRAGAQGAAPAAWQTYCWLDLTSYNDTTARSASGQNFSFSLSDGSTLTFNLKAVSSTGTAATASVAPSWTGAAVGNSSFLNIPGRPILYMNTNGSLVTFTFSNIAIIPPPGVATVTNFAFVAADAESTDNSEYLEFTTNGSAWQILDAVPPTSGSQYPVLTGVNTTTLRESGGGQTGSMGSYIAASNKPSTVTARMQGSGLQGLMFAVRFASITLNKTITGARVNPADQFTFEITSTSSGSALASGTTSGTGNGPFTAAVISTASGIPITLKESMASGSVSAFSRYRASLTCTNSTSGSSTVLPNNLQTSSYNFGSLDFGDVIRCTFNNAPYPHVSVNKQLGTAGRIFATDQFQVRIRQGSTVVATATTAGTGTTITGGAVPLTQLTAGTAYRLDEVATGTTDLTRYTKSLSCSNAYAGSPTVLPTAIDATFSPALGDVISCTIRNTRGPVTAVLIVDKQSVVVSDPVNGTNRPKRVPGAVVRYTIRVTNSGDAAVDASSIIITDVLPIGLVYNAASPVQFANGTKSSGLNSFNAATMVKFSSQTSGGAPYSYTPNTAGYDSNVRGIRINPTGTMAAATGTSQPSFTVSFLTRID